MRGKWLYILAAGILVVGMSFGFIFSPFLARNSSIPPNALISTLEQVTPTGGQSAAHFSGVAVPPTATPTPRPPTPTRSVTTRLVPTTRPTVVVTIPVTPTTAPIADYFGDKIVLIGGPNNTTTVEETSSLQGMRVDASFRNNALITSTKSVRIKAYYDGTFKQEYTQPEFGGWTIGFSYLPPIEPGQHTVRFTINESHDITETNYSNNELSITYTVIGDKTPPNFRIDGPYQINGQTCMRWVDLVDNVFVYTDVWAKWKIDNGAWSAKSTENIYGCITAASGTSHTYTVHAEDLRGNASEQSSTFVSF